ncbi:MAG: DnaD domain protein [Thermomicrobiales bacterium]
MGNSADYRIATGLDLAVGRGVLLRFRTIEDQHERVWYTIATPEAKSAIDRMLQGESLPPRSLWEGDSAPRIEPERPTVFRLYEQNIGLLSPIIADQLVRAMERYPREWIEDAIGEAVAYNRRNWRYIQRILQNWATTGRSEDRPGNDERR